MKEKIAVIGSYAVGMTMTGETFPTPGQTVPGHDFVMVHGGKGSNQAVAAARMGGDVIYGTCIGKDSFGDGAMELYQNEQIDAGYVRRSRKGLATGVGFVLVNGAGENEIMIDFAANNEFSPEDIEDMMPAIKKCKLLLMQLEGSMETVEYAAKRCREEGIPFVLNPAPYVPLSDQLLANCSYLIPNETEARQILGLQPDDPVDDQEVAERIYKKGVKNVIMTLGRKGVCICNDKGKEIVKGLCVQTVDSTGAGDTFSGAFCVAVAEGKTLEEAVRFGNTAAGISVTTYGVIESIPSRKEVEMKMEDL